MLLINTIERNIALKPTREKYVSFDKFRDGTFVAWKGLLVKEQIVRPVLISMVEFFVSTFRNKNGEIKHQLIIKSLDKIGKIVEKQFLFFFS
jgi:hypothetical protein